MIVAISLPTPRNCRLALPVPSSRSYPANSSSSGASCHFGQDQIAPHRQAAASVHHELPRQPPAIGIDAADLEHEPPLSSVAFTSTAPSCAVSSRTPPKAQARSRRRRRKVRRHQWDRSTTRSPASRATGPPAARRHRWMRNGQDAARHRAAIIGRPSPPAPCRARHPARCRRAPPSRRAGGPTRHPSASPGRRRDPVAPGALRKIGHRGTRKRKERAEIGRIEFDRRRPARGSATGGRRTRLAPRPRTARRRPGAPAPARSGATPSMERSTSSGRPSTLAEASSVAREVPVGSESTASRSVTVIVRTPLSSIQRTSRRR
jgi:hypothetical protein